MLVLLVAAAEDAAMVHMMFRHDAAQFRRNLRVCLVSAAEVQSAEFKFLFLFIILYIVLLYCYINSANMHAHASNCIPVRFC